ncbi:ankyrin repeat family protein [Asticcacaulis biprosthecium C19]|uniref:Ankyrin repeat family protein n=1 Tax=Asticcacaulis biprosthecium C19 TaxID=715226 RepID=F4QT74_9CAUL|nr:ankyrin repeat domain-containing protein [Asticcacaulis biprosthecium]EGF89944.1 ankyrin repeat family protein [Asticcacaulis biprosthecium C19]
MTLQSRLLTAFETHDLAEIQSVLSQGLDPTVPIIGKPPVMILIEMYYRSDAFPACLRLLLDHGATVVDPLLLPVLLDDIPALEDALKSNPDYLNHRVHLPSAFVSLNGATLLHLASEYGHLEAATWLLDQGCDPNATADTDLGYNGHTAIFHTVNSNGNRSAAVMRLLLERGACTDLQLQGLWWGRGFEWETLFFDVTPVSFAQMGLLPQIHRREADIYANIADLLAVSGRLVPELSNVPNRYLMS